MLRRHESFNDNLNRKGAYQLAATIENYWRGRGYYGIHTEIAEFKSYHDHHSLFTVRSNMVNGLPPREEVI